MPYQITLPNNQIYTFTYVQGSYGEPASVTLPTGAQINWVWTANGDSGRSVASRTVTVGGQSYTWTYTYNDLATPPTVIVHDPLGNETKHSFGTGPVNGTVLETKAEYFQGTAATGQLIKTVQTDYTSYGGGTSWTMAPIRETTTWSQTNQVTKTETDWDTFTVTNGTSTFTTTWKNPIERREYAFGSGTPGALVRRTHSNYLHLTNSTYRNANIANRATSQIVYDGSGVIQAQTTTAYDGSALAITSGVPNHDYTNFSSTYLIRGNPTTVSRWVNTTSSWLSTVNTYDDLGNLLTMTDPASHTTTYSYSDNWANAGCVPSGVNTHGYVTQVTNALSQNSQTSFFPCTGQVASQKNQNDINASRPGTTYSYDLVSRLLQNNLPNGGRVDVSYNDVAPVSVSTTTKINSAQNLISTVIKDGLGRTSQTQLTSDPQGTVFTDTTYDALGRVATASNPYRSGSDVTSTPGITTYTYDVLDRKTKETYPDSSFLTTAYCGSTTLVTDPTGRWRRSTTDALGRLIKVDEPNAPGATVNTNGCPGTGEPIWVTSYTYDTFGNLKQALQNASRQRNFTYDSLSRLLTAGNPESGTTTYKYDSDAACPTPNSFLSLLVSKTDARGIRTCAQYDALNRSTQINYSNSDPTVAVTYDQSNCLGLTACDNIGHRTSMTDAAGSEALT
jgi:YD repeat-containing protein